MNQDFAAKTVEPARAELVKGFAASELFERTFAEGMALVESVAAYLDGAGRQDSRLLSRDVAVAYAAESMRLTTRLMQLASWLLVQRAVREGDMTPAEACEPRYRVTAPGPAEPPPEGLPLALSDLCARAERLHDRVRHLDQRMYLEPAAVETPHPVLSQHDRLKAAFG